MHVAMFFVQSSIAVCLVFASQQTPCNHPRSCASSNPDGSSGNNNSTSSYGYTRDGKANSSTPGSSSESTYGNSSDDSNRSRCSRRVTWACWFRPFREQLCFARQFLQSFVDLRIDDKP